ncbi:uncharacterized protein LOC143909809 [Arctopsyche grandis]|uniref:uncharacterized protein LOC143909809 n=1 Tax=Arctopsyche grandis TaxID=121162 RepID=UPI00406DA151
MFITSFGFVSAKSERYCYGNRRYMPEKNLQIGVGVSESLCSQIFLWAVSTSASGTKHNLLKEKHCTIRRIVENTSREWHGVWGCAMAKAKPVLMGRRHRNHLPCVDCDCNCNCNSVRLQTSDVRQS